MRLSPAPGRPALVASCVAACAVALPAAAVAADPKPSKGVEKLWEQYPLDGSGGEAAGGAGQGPAERQREAGGQGGAVAPRGSDDAAPTGTRDAAPGRRGTRVLQEPAAAEDSSGLPLLAGVAGTAGAGMVAAGAAVALRRRRRADEAHLAAPAAAAAPPPSGSREATSPSPAPVAPGGETAPSTAPPPSTAPSPSILPSPRVAATRTRRGQVAADFRARARRPRRARGWAHAVAPPAATPVREAPTRSAPTGPKPLPTGLPRVLPPRLDEAWIAEVTWDAAASRFAVRAAPAAGGAAVVVAHTEVLRWPPPDAAAVQALADAVRSVEAVFLGSGWTALPAGQAAWWALRFGWQPAGGPPPVTDSGACTPGVSAGRI